MTRSTERAHIRLAVGILVALSAPALRGDLYGDEYGHTLRYLSGGGVRTILSDPALVHPPLYFLLARAAHAAVGEPWAMRLPSLAFAAATVPAFAAAARVVLGPAFLVPAAYAAALSPFLLEFATEGRAYATVLFFSAASLLAFLAFLERETRARAALLAATVAAGGLTHFIFLLQAAFFALWYVLVRRRVSLLALAAAAAASICWTPVIYLQGRGGGELVAGMLQAQWSGGAAAAVNLLARVAVALEYGYNLFLLGRLDPGRNVGSGQIRDNLPVLAGAACVFIALAVALARSLVERRKTIAFLATGVAVPAALALTGGASGWFLVREKHLAVAWVFVLLLTLAALSWLSRRAWGRAVLGLHVALLAFAIFNGTFRADRYSRRMNWSGLAAELKSGVGPADRVVSYLPAAARIPGVVLGGDGGRLAETVLQEAGSDAASRARAASDLSRDGCATIFLIYEETGRNLLDPGDQVLAALGERRGHVVRDFGRNLKLLRFPPPAEECRHP